MKLTCILAVTIAIVAWPVHRNPPVAPPPATATFKLIQTPGQPPQFEGIGITLYRPVPAPKQPAPKQLTPEDISAIRSALAAWAAAPVTNHSLCTSNMVYDSCVCSGHSGWARWTNIASISIQDWRTVHVQGEQHGDESYSAEMLKTDNGWRVISSRLDPVYVHYSSQTTPLLK